MSTSLRWVTTDILTSARMMDEAPHGVPGGIRDAPDGPTAGRPAGRGAARGTGAGGMMPGVKQTPRFALRLLCLCAVCTALIPAARAAAAPADAGPRVIPDVEYARIEDQRLMLDLYLPRQSARSPEAAPLVVWVHGGAWRSGSRKDLPLGGLVERGYAVASVDYRLSPVARFPAQVHDIKAAVRFLRARRGEYGYDASRIAIAGNSAGGHLAALVGVTNGHSELEGTVGDNPSEKSDVQAIVSLYGMSNLTTILAQ